MHCYQLGPILRLHHYFLQCTYTTATVMAVTHHFLQCTYTTATIVTVTHDCLQCTSITASIMIVTHHCLQCAYITATIMIVTVCSIGTVSPFMRKNHQVQVHTYISPGTCGVSSTLLSLNSNSKIGVAYVEWRELLIKLWRELLIKL